jgi:hypothetical protein
MGALKKIEAARAYMDSNNLKPIWKKELEKVEAEMMEVDRELSTTINNLNYVNDKKDKLVKKKETILQRAAEQDLFSP